MAPCAPKEFEAADPHLSEGRFVRRLRHCQLEPHTRKCMTILCASVSELEANYTDACEGKGEMAGAVQELREQLKVIWQHHECLFAPPSAHAWPTMTDP